MARIILLLMLLFSVTPAFAPTQLHRPIDDPYKLINGKNLATRVFGQMLEKFGEVKIRTSWRVTDLMGYLYTGMPFSNYGNFRRVRLEQWILSQPYHSIEPHQLVAKAAEITNGSILRATMLCWDVLSDGWDDFYNRDFSEKVFRLADITGDLIKSEGAGLSPHGKYIRGSSFSAWYHFFGVAMAAIVSDTNQSVIISPEKIVEMMLHLEEGVLHGDFKDPMKRLALNQEGAKFGFEISRLAKAGYTKESFNQYLSEAGLRADLGYFDQAPEKLPNWALKSGQRAMDYMRDTITPGSSLMASIYDIKETDSSYSLQRVIVDTILEEMKRYDKYKIDGANSFPKARVSFLRLSQLNQDSTKFFEDMIRGSIQTSWGASIPKVPMLMRGAALQYYLRASNIPLESKVKLLTEVMGMKGEELLAGGLKGLAESTDNYALTKNSTFLSFCLKHHSEYVRGRAARSMSILISKRLEISYKFKTLMSSMTPTSAYDVLRSSDVPLKFKDYLISGHFSGNTVTDAGVAGLREEMPMIYATLAYKNNYLMVADELAGLPLEDMKVASELAINFTNKTWGYTQHMFKDKVNELVGFKVGGCAKWVAGLFGM